MPCCCVLVLLIPQMTQQFHLVDILRHWRSNDILFMNITSMTIVKFFVSQRPLVVHQIWYLLFVLAKYALFSISDPGFGAICFCL